MARPYSSRQSHNTMTNNFERISRGQLRRFASTSAPKDAAGHAIQRAQSATVAPQRFFGKAAEPVPSVWPGDAVAVRFRFVNKSEASSFAAHAVLDGSLAPVTPQSFDAGSETVELTVNVKLPFDARPGSRRDLLLTVTNNRTGGYNSAKQQIETRSR